MSKRLLAQTLREKYGFSWNEANNIIQTLLDTIKSQVAQNKKVTLHNFGTFSNTGLETIRFRNIHSKKITTKILPPTIQFKPSKNLLQ